MNYKIILICFFLSVPLMYSQNVGIGEVYTPTEKLDVNGKIKVREVRIIDDKTLAPLYFDSNGVLGRRDEAALITPLFTNRETKFDPAGYSMSDAYGNDQVMICPLLATNTVNNTLGITQPSPYVFKIKSEGYYQYSASIQLHIRGVATNNVFELLGKVEKSKDNGATWQIITATRIQGIGGDFRNIQGVFPTGVTHHNANDLIRLTFSRVRDSSGKLIGPPGPRYVLLSNDGAMDGYNLLILKL